MEFPDRLRLIVVLAFEKQVDACYHFRISSLSQLKSYLAGKILPGAAILGSISLYGFDINWLLTGKGPIFNGRRTAGLASEIEVRIAAGLVPPDYVALYRELIANVDISRGDSGETGSVESVGAGGVGLIEGKPAEAASKKPVKAVKPARS